jgi:hypothetical protein
VRNDCSSQSGADFPGAFTDPKNLVHGPLVLTGATYTDPATVREFGGNKFPLLVRAGYTVTIAIAPEARAFASLAYGDHRAASSATFIACSPGRSWSTAGGEEVTFWSGFFHASRPACIPLDITVGSGRPERVGLQLGARC